MPSAFSAKGNKALVAICCACQKTTPTALMISLAGRENGRPKHGSVATFKTVTEEAPERNWAARSQAARSNSWSMN
jgi:hypothetical protein